MFSRSKGHQSCPFKALPKVKGNSAVEAPDYSITIIKHPFKRMFHTTYKKW